MANPQEQLIRQGTQLQQDLLNLQDGGLLTSAGRAFLRSAGGTTTVRGQDGNPVQVPVHAVVQSEMAQDLQRQLGEVRNNLQHLQAGAYVSTINPLGKVGTAAATTLKPVSKAVGSYPRAVVAGMRLKATEVLMGPSPTMDAFIPKQVVEAAKSVRQAVEARALVRDPEFLRQFTDKIDPNKLFLQLSFRDIPTLEQFRNGNVPQLTELERETAVAYAQGLLGGRIRPEDLNDLLIEASLQQGMGVAVTTLAQIEAESIAQQHTREALAAINTSGELKYADGRLLLQVKPTDFLRTGLALKLKYISYAIQSFLQPPESRIPGLQLAIVDPNALMGQQLAILKGYQDEAASNADDESNDQVNTIPFNAFEPQWQQPSGNRVLSDTNFGVRVQRALWLIPAKTRWIRSIQTHWPFNWEATWGPQIVQKIEKYAYILKPLTRLAPAEGRPESGTIMLRSSFKTVGGTQIPITIRNTDSRLSFFGGTQVIINAINTLGEISSRLNSESPALPDSPETMAVRQAVNDAIRPRTVAKEAMRLAQMIANDPYFAPPTEAPSANAQTEDSPEPVTARPLTSIREADSRLSDFINQLTSEQAPSWEEARRVIANLINTLSSAENLSLPQLEALYQKYRLALQKGNQETVRILASQDAGVITDIMNQLTALMRAKGSNVAGFSNHEIASLRTQGKLPSQPPTPPAQ